MNIVFLDTCYLIAMVNSRDQLNAKATEITKKLESEGIKMVTTDFVLSEFLSYFSELGTHLRTAAYRAVERLREDPTVDIKPATRDLFIAGLKLFGERKDKGWSHVDCCSFITMNKVNATEALTADVHFEQTGYKALLR